MNQRTRLQAIDAGRNGPGEAGSKRAFASVLAGIEKRRRRAKLIEWGSIGLWMAGICCLLAYRVYDLRIPEEPLLYRISGPVNQYSFDFWELFRFNAEDIRMRTIFGALGCAALLFAAAGTAYSLIRAGLARRRGLSRRIAETRAELARLER
jgi:hypothetical protein